jgi:hypothetical protein
MNNIVLARQTGRIGNHSGAPVDFGTVTGRAPATRNRGPKD